MSSPVNRVLKGTSKNLGCCVKIVFTNGSVSCCRNVTEIHFNYPSESKLKQVAFESDIHQTGVTHPVLFIQSFETTLETRQESSF